MIWLIICFWMLCFLFLYGYIGYPALMTLVAGKACSPSTPREWPAVSLIVPAHNEEVVIDEKIRNSLELDYPQLEVIVASDGSTDETVEIATKYKDEINLLAFEQNRGKTTLVQDAVQSAKSDLLILCDANVMFRSDAIKKLVAHFEDQNVGCVTGDVRLQSEESSFGLAESLYYKMERSVQTGESRFGSVMGVDGGMYAIRKELFPILEPDTVLDDFSISMHVIRLNRKLLFDAQAIADENATEAATDEYRRRVRMGIGISQVLSRGYFPRLSQPAAFFLFFSHKILRWFSPALLLGLFICSCVLAWNSMFFLALVVLELLALTLALIGAWLPAARNLRAVVIPFYFALGQLAYTDGILRGFLLGSSGSWSRTTRKLLVRSEIGEE